MNRPDVDAYLSQWPDRFHYVARYIDYASSDRLYRKYRVVLIDGQPFACHLAISSHWIVHYISAEMGLDKAKQREEAQALLNFDTELGLRHDRVFKDIAKVLGLDYVVLDCAELPDGRLLLFEADSRGLIHAADPIGTFPYKTAVMQKAFDAFEALLQRRTALWPHSPF